MTRLISSFKDKYDFLSNFCPVTVRIEDMNYPTVEHAYQASKSKEYFFRKLIVALPSSKAGVAKRRGNTIRLRSDWEDVKIQIMYELLCNKFEQEPFGTYLLETDDSMIIEGNHRHDNFWGICYCGKDRCKDKGKNWMGKLLMNIRRQIRDKDTCDRRYSQ